MCRWPTAWLRVRAAPLHLRPIGRRNHDRALVGGARVSVFGDYHIQNVNKSCGRLKGWMLRFRGVATTYLDSYLEWHRADDRAGSTQSASRVLAAVWG